MITIACSGFDYDYEVRELAKLFLKDKEIEVIPGDSLQEAGAHPITASQITLNLEMDQAEGSIVLFGDLVGEGIRERVQFKKNEGLGGPEEYTKKRKILVKKCLFLLLQKIKPTKLPWGILTGIRPTKIVHELLEQQVEEGKIQKILEEEYLIEKDKAMLLLEIAKIEHQYIYPVDEEKISVYVSIPFCPTRCLYCSFPSNPLNKGSNLVDEYVERLCDEIKGTAQIIKEQGKKIETLYIGGGTPTTLNVAQFEKLFSTLFIHLDLGDIKELTVEAGRPDTIDMDKLQLLKNKGVTRLSINPQTMNDCTLQAIGRHHTVEELIQSYHMARGVGFDNINMDIILGLPGEDHRMVLHTMEELEKLEPTNLTVHTLAIKRASRLKEEEEQHELKEQEEVLKMLEISQQYAGKMGLHPYYMYRQKHMIGNLENIGYSKPGYECIYNMQIMEEKQTIIAMGAGAVSKIVYPKENRLERVPNVKNVEQYIERVEEMVERKRKLLY